MNIGLKTFIRYSGRKLPYDAEIEYLESTGAQWIDTGCLPTPTTRIDLDFMPQNNGVRPFGSDDLRGGVTRRFWVAVGGNGTNLQYNASTNGANMLASNGGASILGVRTTIVAAGKSLTAFGSTQTNSSWTIATDNGCSLGLFAGHRILADDSVVWFAPATMRLYSCTIYGGTNLIRDFIPVRKGNVGYMYDRVSGKLFGNQGTGSFVLGPDIVPVEYLESTGTQYINTVIKTSNNIGLSIDCEGIGLDNWICGGRVGYKTGVLGLYRIPSGVLRACYGTSEAETPFDANRHAIKLEDGILTIDGQQISTFQSQTFSNNSSIYLFNLNTNTTGTPSIIGMAGKVYGATLANNHALVRDFIPVRVGSGSTWEGAMLDRITHKVYRNAGTGNFLYGNDKNK